jgi:AcrR family transcriptional regulator
MAGPEAAEAEVPATVAAAWGVRGRAHKGPKPTLSLARIVDAGVRVADTEGLDAVSMGRVAASLDTAPMSLYRHVSSKEELLRLMVDAAWGESPGPLLPGESWREGLSRWAWAMRAAIRRHPWAARLPISGLPILPREIAWFEDALACLAGTGLTEARKASVILLLSGYVRNLATTEADIAAAVAASGMGLDEWMASYPRMLSQLTDPRRFPALTAFIAAGVFDAADGPDDEFVFGLDRILDGVGALVSRLPLVEVVARVEVGDEPGRGGAPAVPLLSDHAASRYIHGREQREPAEVGVGSGRPAVVRERGQATSSCCSAGAAADSGLVLRMTTAATRAAARMAIALTAKVVDIEAV